MFLLSFIESVCRGLDKSVELKWDAEETFCYVAYPRKIQRKMVNRTWYEARNKCLRLKGDLATTNVTDVASNDVEWLQPNKKYWIGLQRDPLRMPLSGMFNIIIIYLFIYLFIYKLVYKAAIKS